MTRTDRRTTTLATLTATAATILLLTTGGHDPAAPTYAATRPDPTVERFEDGSWRDHTTGQTGCTPGALCDDTAPVADPTAPEPTIEPAPQPVTEPTEPVIPDRGADGPDPEPQPDPEPTLPDTGADGPDPEPTSAAPGTPTCPTASS